MTGITNGTTVDVTLIIADITAILEKGAVWSVSEQSEENREYHVNYTGAAIGIVIGCLVMAVLTDGLVLGLLTTRKRRKERLYFAEKEKAEAAHKIREELTIVDTATGKGEDHIVMINLCDLPNTSTTTPFDDGSSSSSS
jgi:hypothetical protein